MLHRHRRSMKSDTSTKKKTIATYSKNHPIQLPKKEHFLTPDTPEIDWLPSCKEMSLKEDMSKKGTILFVTDIYIIIYAGWLSSASSWAPKFSLSAKR